MWQQAAAIVVSKSAQNLVTINFSHLKDTIPAENWCGFYFILYLSCDFNYISQIRRVLKRRVKAHYCKVRNQEVY